MPTTPSAKNKSPRGSSGPDETPETVADNETYQETATVSENLDTQELPLPVSESEPEVVAVADDSDNKRKPPASMSKTDLKLAMKMTREIAKQLGLSGRTRSVRV